MASAFLHSVCNSAGPQRFCHIAACSAWVPVNHAGPLGSGVRTFSSGTSLASPNVRSSFVLRDVRHSKSQIRNDLPTERISPKD